MALNWNGLITDLVDAGAESYESRVRKLILLAGAVLLALIVVWKLWR